jgi:hypothetical protein
MSHHSESGLAAVEDTMSGDAYNWRLLEQEDESAEGLGEYDAIIAEQSPFSVLEKDSVNRGTGDIIEMRPGSSAGSSLNPLEGSDSIRIHKINGRSARPKNMTITRVQEVMSSGGLTDAALPSIMVEAFSSTHRSEKYIPGICRFSGVDLSKDWKSPENAHSAHAAVLRDAAKNAFAKGSSLDAPCNFQSNTAFEENSNAFRAQWFHERNLATVQK